MIWQVGIQFMYLPQNKHLFMYFQKLFSILQLEIFPLDLEILRGSSFEKSKITRAYQSTQTPGFLVLQISCSLAFFQRSPHFVVQGELFSATFGLHAPSELLVTIVRSRINQTHPPQTRKQHPIGSISAILLI